jgi:gluconate kinase
MSLHTIAQICVSYTLNSHYFLNCSSIRKYRADPLKNTKKILIIFLAANNQPKTIRAAAMKRMMVTPLLQVPISLTTERAWLLEGALS